MCPSGALLSSSLERILPYTLIAGYVLLAGSANRAGIYEQL